MEYGTYPTVSPAIKRADFLPIEPKTKGAEVIHGEIIKNIESADYVLCDISALNPNVFFELGIRTSLNKPVCIIKDELIKNDPFDTHLINNHTYSSALNPWTLESQIENLARHIKDSYDKCEGLNSLWKYFSLSSTAQPIKDGNSEDKIDFLIRQTELINEKINRPDSSLNREILTPTEFSSIVARLKGQSFNPNEENIKLDDYHHQNRNNQTKWNKLLVIVNHIISPATILSSAERDSKAQFEFSSTPTEKQINHVRQQIKKYGFKEFSYSVADI